MCRTDKFVAYIFVLLSITVCSTNAKYKNYGHILESLDYSKALSLLTPEKILTNYDENFASYGTEEIWLNANCSRDLLILQESIALRETWALTMLDSSSKLQSGLLQGNLIDLGQYDECLAVYSKTSDHDIRGRHCMYSIKVTQGNITIPINPTLSICVPTSCSADDIKSLFNTTISWIDQFEYLKIDIASSTCSPTDQVVWNLEFTICLSIVLAFVTFLVGCTVIEMSQGCLDVVQHRHPFMSTLAMFSLRKSALSILNMDMKVGTLPGIHGIRFLSMAWVVLGHEFLFTRHGATVNSLDFIKWMQSWESLYIFLAPFAVDTFFAMSGFLMTYLFLKQMPKEKSFNVPMYYLHRYIRLTPVMSALIVFAIVFLPKLGSGAQWDTVLGPRTKNCRSNWWHLLLYVQNFADGNDLCLEHLWYLAVDMQLFWISPLILYPLYKKPIVGLIFLTVLLFASLAIPAIVIGIRKLPVTSLTHITDQTMSREIFTSIYEIPYHRAGPWLVGIFLGYEVAKYNRQLSRRMVITGWSIALSSFAFCTFGLRSFINPDYEYNVVWETFYSAVSRPIWGLGVCWIIYACLNNCAGPVSKILSSRIFLPLSRLSYCIYLVHYILLNMNVASLRTSTYVSEYRVWLSYFSTLTLSIVVAFLFSILFESPIMVLEKMLMKRKRVSRRESQKE